MTDDRRIVLADAALAVLAATGARGLTHRAVHRTAGIAEGSTSYYFRTRAALLQACAERLAAHTMQVIGPADGAELTVDGLIALAERAVSAWTADEGWLIRARHELLLESARYSELRGPIEMAAEHVRALIEQRLDAWRPPDPAERTGDLIACLDGLALAHAVAGTVDRNKLARSVSRVISGLLRQD